MFMKTDSLGRRQSRAQNGQQEIKNGAIGYFTSVGVRPPVRDGTCSSRGLKAGAEGVSAAVQSIRDAVPRAGAAYRRPRITAAIPAMAVLGSSGALDNAV